jgi:regulator of protease activity HflC (stomatin/prohibitin superfamily)
MNALLSPSPLRRSIPRWVAGSLVWALAVAGVAIVQIGPLRWMIFLLVAMIGSILIAPKYRFALLILLFFLTGMGLAFDLIPLLWPMDEPIRVELTQRTGSVAVLWLVSTLGLAGLAALVLTTLAFLSSELIFALHPVGELGRGMVILHLLTMALGIQGGYWIVENGEVKQKKDGVLRLLGGPGLLDVSPCHAVVLERGGQITGIVGPRIHTLRPFERVRGVIRLEPRLLTIDLRDISMAGGLTVPRVLAKVGYHFPLASIEEQDEGDKRFTGVLRDDLYPTRRENLKKMLAVEPDPAKWDRAVEQIAAMAIRAVIGRHTLEELFPLHREPVSVIDGRVQGPYDLLSSEAYQACREKTIDWGIEITMLQLEMKPPEELHSRALAPWVAEREKVLSLARGEADAKRERAFEEIRLETRRKAVREMIERLTELYEKLPPEAADRLASLVAKTMVYFAEDTAQGMRLISALEKMIEGSQVFVSVGPSPAIFPAAPARPEREITGLGVESHQ